MMGRTHGVTGALAFQASLFWSVTTTWFPHDLGSQALGTVVCVGAALLPDMDHEKATASNTYGPVTRGISHLVQKLSGGHRNGTHSILGIAILGASAQAAVTYQAVPGWGGVVSKIWLALLLILASAGAVRLLKIDGSLDDLLPIPVCIALVVLQPVPLDFVPLALVLGAAVHVAGDMLTNGGCPLFWPYAPGKGKRAKPKRYALGLFKTNGPMENWLVLPCSVLGTLALIGWRIFG
jgi:membrane-bound metal-dependent hydrolase YbcI (DUF457 family)